MPHTERPQNPHIAFRDIGIWRVVYEKSNGPSFHWSRLAQVSHVVKAHVHLIRCVWTLTTQVIAIAPIHLALYFVAQIYYALGSVIDLYSSQILLDSVCETYRLALLTTDPFPEGSGSCGNRGPPSTCGRHQVRVGVKVRPAYLQLGLFARHNVCSNPFRRGLPPFRT